MLIYQSPAGKVEKGLFSGFKFTLAVNGRRVPATPWMKHRMGELHQGLKSRSLDCIKDDAVRSLYWEYFLDLAHFPPNGARHMVEAETPVNDVVAAIADALGRST